MGETLARAALGWTVSFVAVLVYWLSYELAEPGQQYADPILPCAWLALFGAMFVVALGGRR